MSWGGLEQENEKKRSCVENELKSTCKYCCITPASLA